MVLARLPETTEEAKDYAAKTLDIENRIAKDDEVPMTFSDVIH